MGEDMPPPMSAALERSRNFVTLTFECGDDYEAMLLYDKMARELHNGRLGLDLNGARVREPR